MEQDSGRSARLIAIVAAYLWLWQSGTLEMLRDEKAQMAAIRGRFDHQVVRCDAHHRRPALSALDSGQARNRSRAAIIANASSTRYLNVSTPALDIVGGTDYFEVELGIVGDTSINILATRSWFAIEKVA